MMTEDFTEYRRLILDKLEGLERGQGAHDARLSGIEAKLTLFEHDYKTAKRLFIWLAGIVGAALTKLGDYLPKLLGLKG